MDNACQQTTGQGRDDEDPQIGQRLPTHEDRRPERPRRVHGHTGHVDADKVDRRERQPDGQTGKGAMRPRPGRAKDNRDKDKGRHELEDQRSLKAVLAQIAGAIAVLAKTVFGQHVLRLARRIR